MSRFISVKSYDEFTSTGGGGVDFLIGNVGDKVLVRHTLEFSMESLCPVRVSGTDTLTRTDDGSWIADGWRVGDTFETENVGSNDGTPFTITAIEDTIITFSGVGTDGTWTADVSIHWTTPVTDLEYFYGLNNNPGTVAGMVDVGNSQKYTGTGLDANDLVTVTNLTPVGYSKAWEVGQSGVFYVSVVGNGIADHKQSFIIDHYTLIVPLSLDGQESNFEDENPPTYFEGERCLSWTASVVGKVSRLDPNSPHKATSLPIKGATGWFNENFNGLPSNYSIYSTTFTTLPSNASATGVNSCFDTTVVLKITSQNLFTSATKGKVFFHWFAEGESAYKQTTTNLNENFRYDSALLTAGAGAINGIAYGTDYQAITSATLVFNNSSLLTCTFTVNFSQAGESFFTTLKKYVIGFATQNVAVTTTVASDRVSLLADYGNFLCDLKVENYFQAMQDMEFYMHPKSVSQGYTDLKGIAGDIWLGRGYFGVKKSASVKINTLEIAVEAVNHVNGDRFDLERFSYDLRKFIPNDDYEQDINIRQSRNFNTWDIYNYITLSRCPALDTVDYCVYQLNYPVKLMDEADRILPAGLAYFQTPTQNWAQYSEADDWGISLTVYAEVEGEQVQTNAYSNYVNVREYDSPTNYMGYPHYYELLDFVAEIVFLKPQTEISRQGLVSTTDVTLVRAIVKGDFRTFPAGNDDFWGEIALGSTQTGNKDTCSTEFDCRPDSVWIGYDLVTPTQVLSAKLTIINDNEAHIECLLDGRKLDPSVNTSTYYFTARVGYMESQILLAQENLEYILQENGFGIIIT